MGDYSKRGSKLQLGNGPYVYIGSMMDLGNQS